MLYLIGLGLGVESISYEGLETLKRCKKIYIEEYTVDFPYSVGELKEKLDLKRVFPADRDFVESCKIIDEAVKLNVALLIYGSPLMATTHIALIDEAKKSNIKYKVINASSVLDGVGETGLQLYKFGKIVSLPKWNPKKGFTPDSFMETIKENKSINAHTLILMDIGLEFDYAVKQLEESFQKYGMKFERFVLCQRLGAKRQKIRYLEVSEAKEYKEVLKPYCIILPGKLHFAEKEFLETLSLG